MCFNCLYFNLVFVVLLLRFERTLCILIAGPYSDIWLAKIFLPVYSLLFHSLNSGFYRANIFYFVKTNLSILSLMNHAFDVVSENSSPNPQSQKCSSMSYTYIYDPLWVNFCSKWKVYIKPFFAYECPIVPVLSFLH